MHSHTLAGHGWLRALRAARPVPAAGPIRTAAWKLGLGLLSSVSGLDCFLPRLVLALVLCRDAGIRWTDSRYGLSSEEHQALLHIRLLGPGAIIILIPSYRRRPGMEPANGQIAAAVLPKTTGVV